MIRRLLCALVLVFLASGAARAETRPFVRGSWADILAAHAGRPLVVHLWSLTCAPCLADLPRWREAQRRHPSMALVLVSTDAVTETPRLERALQRAGLGGVEGWAFAESFVERLRFEIDPGWHGELPITRLIAADGSARTVTGRVEESDLAAWLKR